MGELREDFNAFNDSILCLDDFYDVCADFEAGIRFRNIFKVFKYQTVEGAGAI
jgi:hypothetical protein